MLAAAFAIGYGTAHLRPRSAVSTPEIDISVASQGSVLASHGPLHAGVADAGDGILRVDVRNGKETKTSYYPVK